jgi:hypothetical protein
VGTGVFVGGGGVSVGSGVFVGGTGVLVGMEVFVGISIVVSFFWVIASPSMSLDERSVPPVLHPARIIIAKKIGKVLYLNLICLRLLFIFSPRNDSSPKRAKCKDKSVM